MDGQRTSGKGEDLVMRVACMNQGNLFSVKAVLLQRGTIFQGMPRSRAGQLRLQLERLWNHRVVRLVRVCCSLALLSSHDFLISCIVSL